MGVVSAVEYLGAAEMPVSFQRDAHLVSATSGSVDRIGQSVQLGYLGTFGVSVSSAGKDTPEVLTVRDVKQKRVVYTPSTELKSKISALPCEVIG